MIGRKRPHRLADGIDQTGLRDERVIGLDEYIVTRTTIPVELQSNDAHALRNSLEEGSIMGSVAWRCFGWRCPAHFDDPPINAQLITIALVPRCPTAARTAQ